MSDLLASVTKAHGGLDRWLALRTGKATVVSGGELLDRKAPQTHEPRQMTISLHEEFASVTPFGAPEKKTSFRPERVAIETLEGKLLSERLNPRDHFLGHDLDTKWDPLDRAYFNGYAMWVYLNAPFMFNLPGFRTEEIAPIQEKGEKWQGLRVIFPPNFASHSTVQDFYFGNDFLLRRQDYTLDIAGGHKIANYALDVARWDGLLIPTKRRAYLCDDDKYRVLYNRLFISIDFSDISYV